MREETDACMEAGMVGHLVKPIDPAALATALARYGRSAPEATPESGGPSTVDEGYLRLLVDSLGAAEVARLVAELPAHARPHRERLGAAAGEIDLPRMQAAAHALAGMAANLGLTALAELTAAIEEDCRAGRAKEAAALCGRLDASFADAMARIETLCSDRSPSA